jgi:hypothetical protein
MRLLSNGSLLNVGNQSSMVAVSAYVSVAGQEPSIDMIKVLTGGNCGAGTCSPFGVADGLKRGLLPGEVGRLLPVISTRLVAV